MKTSAGVVVQNVIEQLQNLDNEVTKLLEERVSLRNALEKLKIENQNLESRISVAVSEINEYLKELEKIKAYYVNSNNNN